MTESQERGAVVAEARSWIGTPYRHMGLAKGPNGGVDCAQLVWCVFHNLGLTPDMSLEAYPPDFMLHAPAAAAAGQVSASERYLQIVLDRAHEVAETQAKRGDLVLYRVGRLFAHGAIIVDPGWPHIVHAWADARAVIADNGVKHRLARRPRKFFSRWPSPAPHKLAGGVLREE